MSDDDEDFARRAAEASKREGRYAEAYRKRLQAAADGSLFEQGDAATIAKLEARVKELEAQVDAAASVLTLQCKVTSDVAKQAQAAIGRLEAQALALATFVINVYSDYWPDDWEELAETYESCPDAELLRTALAYPEKS